MNEKEININAYDGPGAGAGEPSGPDIERLLQLRRRAEAFGNVADRASSFVTRSGLSPYNILESIPNTSGE